MKLVVWLALGVLIGGGCSTTPQGTAKAGSKPGSAHGVLPVANRGGSPSKRSTIVEPPENCARERVRGREDHWRPEVSQQHGDEQQHASRHIFRGIYATFTTEDVKSIVRRRSELLWDNYGVRDLSLGAALQIEAGDVAEERLLDEMLEAKQELLNRWKAGEASAGLPEFAK